LADKIFTDFAGNVFFVEFGERVLKLGAHFHIFIAHVLSDLRQFFRWVIAGLTGHTDIKTTKEYLHIQPETAQLVSEAYSKALSGL